ncbi:hypothetical protein ES708_35269 [subsurface metagenome]
MPSLQEVEQFKYLINELGDEPGILAEREEEIEDIPPPEQGLPEGLSDLLETPEGALKEPVQEAVPGEQPEAPAAPPSEQEVDLSGLDILEGIELPEAEAPETASEVEEGPAAEAPAEGFWSCPRLVRRRPPARPRKPPPKSKS